MKKTLRVSLSVLVSVLAFGASAPLAFATTLDVYQTTLGSPSGNPQGNVWASGSATPFLAARTAAIDGTLTSRTTYTPAESSIWGTDGAFGSELYMFSVVKNIPAGSLLQITKTVEHKDAETPSWTSDFSYTYDYPMATYTHITSTVANDYLSMFDCPVGGAACTFVTGASLAEDYSGPPALGSSGIPPTDISKGIGFQVRQTINAKVITGTPVLTGATDNPRGYRQGTGYTGGNTPIDLGTLISTSTVPQPTTVYVDPAYITVSCGGHECYYDAFPTIQAAINAVAANGTINIAADISGITEELIVNRAVTINGGNHTLTFTSALNALADGHRDGIFVSANGTTINNLSVVMAGTPNHWDGVYGIQFYGVTGGVVNNYTGTGADAALLVNGSAVTLTGATTVSGNEFGGIEVSKGTPPNASALTVTGTLVNGTEAYGLPTIWLVNGQGSVTGANVPSTTSTTVKAGQTQYYLTAGNAMAAGLAAINLGAAATYAVLGGTYNNTSEATRINGDVGFTTGPAVAPLGTRTNYGSADPYSAAGTAQTTALTNLNGQACTFTFATGAIVLATDTQHGSPTYTPGVYCIDGAVSVGAGITLSGAGTYIFRSTGALNAEGSSIVTLAGALADRVFWTPNGATTLKENSTFIGNVIPVSQPITLLDNVSWIGRALTFGHGVTTGAADTITVPDVTVLSALNAAKNAAQTLITAAATEGTVPGNHVVGSLATLSSALTAANATSADAQSVVDGQVTALNAAIAAYNAALVPPYDTNSHGGGERAIPAVPATKIEDCKPGDRFNGTTGKSCTVSATPATPSTNSNGNANGRVLGAATFNFASNLAVGSRGADVTALQQFLIDNGFSIPAGATGYFGAQTKAAAIAFQKARGIASTGFVGPLTRGELNKGSLATSGSNLSSGQASAIVGFLQSFGADANVIANVKAALGL